MAASSAVIAEPYEVGTLRGFNLLRKAEDFNKSTAADYAGRLYTAFAGPCEANGQVYQHSELTIVSCGVDVGLGWKLLIAEQWYGFLWAEEPTNGEPCRFVGVHLKEQSKALRLELGRVDQVETLTEQERAYVQEVLAETTAYVFLWGTTEQDARRRFDALAHVADMNRRALEFHRNTLVMLSYNQAQSSVFASTATVLTWMAYHLPKLTSVTYNLYLQSKCFPAVEDERAFRTICLEASTLLPQNLARLLPKQERGHSTAVAVKPPPPPDPPPPPSNIVKRPTTTAKQPPKKRKLAPQTLLPDDIPKVRFDAALFETMDESFKETYLNSCEIQRGRKPAAWAAWIDNHDDPLTAVARAAKKPYTARVDMERVEARHNAQVTQLWRVIDVMRDENNRIAEAADAYALALGNSNRLRTASQEMVINMLERLDQHDLAKFLTSTKQLQEPRPMKIPRYDADRIRAAAAARHVLRSTLPLVFQSAADTDALLMNETTNGSPVVLPSNGVLLPQQEEEDANNTEDDDEGGGLILQVVKKEPSPSSSSQTAGTTTTTTVKKSTITL